MSDSAILFIAKLAIFRTVEHYSSRAQEISGYLVYFGNVNAVKCRYHGNCIYYAEARNYCGVYWAHDRVESRRVS